jgi:FG-GAP-like repeat/Secretion system C-terminal sorting domain
LFYKKAGFRYFFVIFIKKISMKPILFTLLAFCFIFAQTQEIPFNTTPDWESQADGRISTGLGLADINGDGWKDMIVADGNDIHQQHLTVYYNQGNGTFLLTPDWTSEDIDYHGHLAVGDLDNDGWMDVAVSVYIGDEGFHDPGKLKIYFNLGGELETIPSFESMSFFSFSCAMGDADGDGDLDIAVACSEMYNDVMDFGRVFYNENGQFDNSNIWQSDITMGAIDVDFGDIDFNGYLDLVFTSEMTPNYIYFADSLGNLQTAPGWVSTDAENYVNSLDIGYDIGLEDPYSYVVMTGNDQLGGDGKVKMYEFRKDGFDTIPAWLSHPFGYGSGIKLYDLHDDGFPDLIYGGWWLPVNIALSTGTGFQLEPAYTSASNSVVESILVSDLGRESIIDTQYIQIADKWGSIVILPHQVVENVSSVSIDDYGLSEEMWKHIPGKNWITLSEKPIPGGMVSVKYNYSPHGDMVVSNWDSSKGNYIFYNTNPPVSVHDIPTKNTEVVLAPNPASDYIYLKGLTYENGTRVSIFNLSGVELKYISTTEIKNGRISLADFSPGIYFLKIITKDKNYMLKFIIIK